uniref:Uncharacterized protein n=1 Tax=Tetranychus urticae TaxID=32264 RepID=A0A158P5J5_TETUR
MANVTMRRQISYHVPKITNQRIKSRSMFISTLIIGTRDKCNQIETIIVWI